jgi:hypothetical protein
MRKAHAITLVGAIGVASLSCQERITKYKPFLTGVEGAKMQTAPVVETGPAIAAGEESAGTLVRENDDGSVTLISKSGRQLMAHIQRTLAEEEKEQFTEQVLSEITRGEYFERGLDPGEAFDRLRKHQKDISKLFSRMPMGEHSPNVLMERVSRNVFRVRVTGQAKKGLDRWTGFDMVLEKGNWRLRWFVS